MRRHGLARTIASVLPLLFSGVSIAEEARPPPPGWAVFRTGSLGSNDLDCAARASTYWEVASVGDQLTIAERSAPRRDFVNRISFAGGSLRGEDGGEWGGGIWWVDAWRLRSAKLSSENLVGFLQTRFGMLGFVGLDHLSLRRGQILIIHEPRPGAVPVASVLTELGEAPRAFTIDHSGSILVATGTRILRVADPGPGTTLFASSPFLPPPGSIAITSAGDVAVGMRLFVLRLLRSTNGPRAQWLLPADCRRFTPTTTSCGCSGN